MHLISLCYVGLTGSVKRRCAPINYALKYRHVHGNHALLQSHFPVTAAKTLSQPCHSPVTYGPVCLTQVAQLLCTSRRRVRLVTPEEALQLTGFMTSTVPPVGHSVPLPTLLDAAVTTLKGPIYAGGGDPDVEMVVTVDQLVSHSHARVASIADVPAAGQTPSQPSLSTVDRSPPMQHPPPDDDSSSSSSETPGSLEPAQLSPMPLAAGATAVVAGSALPPTNSVAPNSVTAVPSSQTGPAASPTDATESQTACGLSQTRQYSLPVPWPAGAQHVTLTGVIARKSRCDLAQFNVCAAVSFCAVHALLLPHTWHAHCWLIRRSVPFCTVSAISSCISPSAAVAQLLQCSLLVPHTGSPSCCCSAPWCPLRCPKDAHPQPPHQTRSAAATPFSHTYRHPHIPAAAHKRPSNHCGYIEPQQLHSNCLAGA